MSTDDSCSCSSSNQEVAGHLAADRPKLLVGIGSAVVSLTYYVLRESRRLPYFVGPVIGVVEDIVSPRFQPLAVKVGTESLYLLSLADEKLYALGEITAEKVPFVSGFVSNAKGVHSMFEKVATVAFYAYDQVCERGVVGGAADTWVKYEVLVKSKSAETLKVVKRCPFLGAFVPVIFTVGTPIASAISSWLVKRSESQEKHLVFHEVRSLDDEMDLKDTSEGKLLFVVNNGAEESSRMDALQISSAVDFADRNSTRESAESSTPLGTAKESDSFGEPRGAQPGDGAAEKGKSNALIVARGSADDEDSDDELSALFDAGWSFRNISPSRKVLVEPESMKKGWW